MAALLVHDVRNSSAPACPANRSKAGIRNALELFKHGQVHGGMFRAPYTPDSIGELSVAVHFLGGPKHFAVVSHALLAALVGAVALALI